MNKQKALLGAAVASLIAAGAVTRSLPAFANEGKDDHKADKKHGCKGKAKAGKDKNGCKGKEGCKGGDGCGAKEGGEHHEEHHE
jgi:uncharacterized membrane protein